MTEGNGGGIETSPQGLLHAVILLQPSSSQGHEHVHVQYPQEDSGTQTWYFLVKPSHHRVLSYHCAHRSCPQHLTFILRIKSRILNIAHHPESLGPTNLYEFIPTTLLLLLCYNYKSLLSLLPAK